MSDILSVPSLVHEITAASERAPRVLVGIDGPGASGKSTLAEQVAALLPGAHLVHVDDFYLPTTQQQDRRGQVGPLFDLPRLRADVVEPAARGSALRYRRYDWGSDALAEWIEVPADVPVVVEGVYCLEESMRGFYTYSIFCLADRALRLRRGLERDGEDARSQWVDEWMPMEDAYDSGQQPRRHADLVVDSSAAGADGPRFAIVTEGRE